MPLKSVPMTPSPALLPRKSLSAWKQFFIAVWDADINSTHASTSSSAATPTATAAPDVNAFKKSCKICASRKIKCEIIAGSNPRLCKYCQEKGLACEFELKKSRQQALS